MSPSTANDPGQLIHKLAARVSYLETELCEQNRAHIENIETLKKRFADIEDTKKPGSWVFVGREHQDLNVPENSLLRWGLNAAWVEKRVSGSFKATNQFFGRDPLHGTGKVVEMWVQ